MPTTSRADGRTNTRPSARFVVRPPSQSPSGRDGRRRRRRGRGRGWRTERILVVDGGNFLRPVTSRLAAGEGAHGIPQGGHRRSQVVAVPVGGPAHPGAGTGQLTPGKPEAMELGDRFRV